MSDMGDLPDFEQLRAKAQDLHLDELVDEAEEKLRKGMAVVGEWSEQARELVRTRPAIVLAGVAVAGFITGLLVANQRGRRESKGV